MARKRRRIHPGEILAADFLEPLDVSQYRPAQDLRSGSISRPAMTSRFSGMSPDRASRRKFESFSALANEELRPAASRSSFGCVH